MKKNRLKVGIITFHYVNNYGGVLQSYALSKILKSKCYVETEIINYRNWFISFTDAVRILPISLNIKEISSGLKTFNKRINRVKKLHSFIKDNDIITKKCFSSYSLKREKQKKDKYICGSDQIWNPILTFGVDPNYYLQFVKDENDKIAYAPSMGTNRIPRIFINKMSKYINSIEHISIREKNGKELINKWTGRKANRLIDPTFLLNKEEWTKIAKYPLKNHEPYILLYIMQKDDSMYNYVRLLKEKLKLRIVEISRYGYNPGFIDETLIDIGPEEFIGLFKNASYVCTNSYHGLVFSLIFKKKIFLVRCKVFMARIENLCDLLEIDYHYDNIENKSLHHLIINYDNSKIIRNISKERKKAIIYLTNSLYNENDNIKK